MSKAKTQEERQFYLLSIKEQYSSRELERQINSAYYERYMISNEKNLPEELNKTREKFF